MGRGGGDGARRGQRGNGTAEQPEQPFNARGARDAKGTQAFYGKERCASGRGGGRCGGRWGEKGRKERPQGWARVFSWNLVERSEVREGTEGAARVFPETWNLQPGTEVNSHTDGHGRTRTNTDREAWGDGAKRSLKHTGARPVDGAGGREGARGNGTASALGERSYKTVGG
jgi:hypothetical protein